MVEDVSFPTLSDGDKEPFQQMTFTLHDTQVDIVQNALGLAKGNTENDLSGNTNTNGNAIANICREWVHALG